MGITVNNSTREWVNLSASRPREICPISNTLFALGCRLEPLPATEDNVENNSFAVGLVIYYLDGLVFSSQSSDRGVALRAYRYVRFKPQWKQHVCSLF